MIETTVVPFPDREFDHSGDLLAPLTSAGLHYEWAVQRPGSTSTIYSTDPDGVFEVLIEDYDATDDPAVSLEVRAEAARARIDQRAQFTHAHIVNHVAQAVLAGQLSVDQEAVLERCGDYLHPLTVDEVPEWTAPVPLVMPAVFYGDRARLAGLPELVPPAGNVVLLDVTDPSSLLEDLGRIGALRVQRFTPHSSPTSAPVRVFLDRSDELELPGLLDALEHAVLVGEASGEDDHVATVRLAAARIGTLDTLPGDLEAALVRVAAAVTGEEVLASARQVLDIAPSPAGTSTPAPADADDTAQE